MRAVELEDFVSCAEDVEAVRRRLGAQRRSRVCDQAHPSILLWKEPVASWIASAAGAEREVLGAFMFREVACTHECVWELSFDEHELKIRVRLAPSTETSNLNLTFEALDDSSTGFVALEISERGADVPREQIRPQLREQILVALDTLGSANSTDEAQG
jgi:hypothetical protein